MIPQTGDSSHSCCGLALIPPRGDRLDDGATGEWAWPASLFVFDLRLGHIQDDGPICGRLLCRLARGIVPSRQRATRTAVRTASPCSETPDLDPTHDSSSRIPRGRGSEERDVSLPSRNTFPASVMYNTTVQSWRALCAASSVGYVRDVNVPGAQPPVLPRHAARPQSVIIPTSREKGAPAAQLRRRRRSQIVSRANSQKR